MANLGNFNPDAVADGEDRNFDLLPTGWQNAQITESDLKPTSSGSGQRLNLTFEILDGPYANRKIWEGLNIANANPQAQEIAQRDLKAICKAVGHVGVLSDSEHLHFKPLRIKVGVSPAKGEYEAKNKVSAYDAYGSSGPAAPARVAPAAAAAATAKPAAGKSLPWQQ